MNRKTRAEMFECPKCPADWGQAGSIRAADVERRARIGRLEAKSRRPERVTNVENGPRKRRTSSPSCVDESLAQLAAESATPVDQAGRNSRYRERHDILWMVGKPTLNHENDDTAM